MEDNNTPINNPWSSLSTITTFDKGNDARTTIRLNNVDTPSTNGKVIGVVTPASLLIESLIQQLCTMFEGDTVRRNKLYFAICDRLHELELIDSSYNMMEFETLRGQYQRALYHLVTVARASTGSESALHIPSCLMGDWSRYRREFQEISFIAAGGFGNVFKALHRLDGIEYAVKKIIVRSGRVKSIMQHLEEVKTLAKLNHTNIVSYKGAWIEPTLPSSFIPSLPCTARSQNRLNTAENSRKTRSNKSRTSQSNFDIRSQSNSCKSRSNHGPIENDRQEVPLSYNTRTNYRTGRRIVEEDSSEECSTEETNSNSVSFRNDSRRSNDNDTRNDANYTDGSNSIDESESNKQICPYVTPVTQQYATLYIQMALCDKTLQQWMDERVDTTSQTIITAILTQILCGLDYIHSRGIVHHDIKPSNIFISTSGYFQIQLGDFGLACPLQRESHHSVLGTHMYAAPEQLEGKCNPKSDVYSVGIVLLQLLVRTTTHMERVRIIGDLKNGQIPTTLTATYPKWSYIVSQLVQKDPNKRPSTSELLQDLNEDKDAMIAQLRNNVTEKDNTIKELQERILTLEAQIAKLTIENTES